MNYIEWLRVRNCLRTLVIVLGVLVLLAAVIRVTLADYTTPQALVRHMVREPGATETHTTLPDGTARTIIVDPAKQTYVTVDDRGSSGLHIVITEPSQHVASRRGRDDNEVHGNVGINVSTVRHGGLTTTTIDTNGSVPLRFYLTIATVIAFIVATLLAAPLAREADGHLEITLTKPVSRFRYAMGAIGADIAGVLGAGLIAMLAGYLCELLFGIYRVGVFSVTVRDLAMCVAAPAAWYAMLVAATTWFSRAYGAILGLAWPVAIVVGALAIIPPSNPIGIVVHDVGYALSRLDPLTYVSVHGPQAGNRAGDQGNFAMRFGIEILFFVVYAALALVRWERVEA